MDMLSQERREKAYKLFRIFWYINLACVIAAVWGALFFVRLVLAVPAEDVGDLFEVITNTSIILGLAIIACVLLMGAGISRYQSRLEGQHLELKQAINKVLAAVQAPATPKKE